MGKGEKGVRWTEIESNEEKLRKRERHKVKNKGEREWKQREMI